VDVMFSLMFSDLQPSLEAKANGIITRFTHQGYALKSQRDLVVRGRKAEDLEFTALAAGYDINLLLIPKWPVIYTLTTYAKSNSSDTLKRIEDALPESVEIQ
jgi:hypothetical protein